MSTLRGVLDPRPDTPSIANKSEDSWEMRHLKGCTVRALRKMHPLWTVGQCWACRRQFQASDWCCREVSVLSPFWAPRSRPTHRMSSWGLLEEDMMRKIQFWFHRNVRFAVSLTWCWQCQPSLPTMYRNIYNLSWPSRGVVPVVPLLRSIAAWRLVPQVRPAPGRQVGVDVPRGMIGSRGANSPSIQSLWLGYPPGPATVARYPPGT